MENTNLNNASMDDIVFEDRNKAYGAYQLRKEFSKTFLIAMLFSATFSTLLFFTPDIYKFISGIFGADSSKKNEKEQIVEAIIEDIPLDPETPPPPAVEIPPPKVEMIKFLPPEIKPDIEIKKEEIPPTQEELEEKANIGNINQDGDKEEIVIEGPTGNSIVDDGADDMVYTVVEERPLFPGGEKAMYKFLSDNMVYPKKYEKMGIGANVVIYLEIDKEGNVSNVSVLKGVPQEEFNKEALRVVSMMPKWKPGRQNGKPVKVKLRIPIKFSLPTDDY